MLLIQRTVSSKWILIKKLEKTKEFKHGARI